MSKKKNLKTNFLEGLFLVIAVLLVSIIGVYFAIKNLSFGLDLQGGFEVLYQVDSVDGSEVTPEMVNVEVLEEVALKLKSKKATDTRKPQQLIWLRIHGDFNENRDMASFSYSTDGENFVSIGRDVKMVFDYQRHFMGTKFAIFNYATKKTGGYVDVDSFKYDEF